MSSVNECKYKLRDAGFKSKRRKFRSRTPPMRYQVFGVSLSAAMNKIVFLRMPTQFSGSPGTT